MKSTKGCSLVILKNRKNTGFVTSRDLQYDTFGVSCITAAKLLDIILYLNTKGN